MTEEIQPIQQTDPNAGIYKHYKGTIYIVLGTALDTETNKDVIIYKELLAESRFFTRPVDVFFEPVTIEGELVPRFKKLTEEETAEHIISLLSATETPGEDC